jgi:hypothetical protein
VSAVPAGNPARRHVPLFIHLPGQETKIDIGDPFPAVNLRKELIHAIDSGHWGSK